MRKSIFKTLNQFGGLNYLRHDKKNNLTVLSLHRIANETDYFFQPILPHLFEELLVYVQKYYEVTTFKMLGTTPNFKKPPLILSFDDGYYDFIEHALPLLKKHNLPANHNLVNCCLNNNEIIWTQKLNDFFNYFKQNKILSIPIFSRYGLPSSVSDNQWNSFYLTVFQQLLQTAFDKTQALLSELSNSYPVTHRSKMMNWEDAKHLVENNIEIGSHTYHHKALSMVTSGAELEIEIKKSVDELEQQLQIPITVIALPNGLYNEQVKKICEQIGIKYFLLVDDKTNPIAQINTNFNAIDRIYLMNEPIHEMQARVELFHSKIKKIL